MKLCDLDYLECDLETLNKEQAQSIVGGDSTEVYSPQPGVFIAATTGSLIIADYSGNRNTLIANISSTASVIGNLPDAATKILALVVPPGNPITFSPNNSVTPNSRSRV